MFTKVGVVGSGIMGTGIAQASAQAGISVVVIDIDTNQHEKSKAAIESNLHVLVEKGKVSRDYADSRYIDNEWRVIWRSL